MITYRGYSRTLPNGDKETGIPFERSHYLEADCLWAWQEAAQNVFGGMPELQALRLVNKWNHSAYKYWVGL